MKQEVCDGETEVENRAAVFLSTWTNHNRLPQRRLCAFRGSGDQSGHRGHNASTRFSRAIPAIRVYP
jgi:hypothetical protein